VFHVHVNKQVAERLPFAPTFGLVQASFAAVPAATVTESPVPLLIVPSETVMFTVSAL